MILKMLGKTQIHRQTKKVKLSKALDLNSDKGSYVRSKFNPEGQVTPLTNQESLITLSEADSLIALPEKSKKLSAGDLVNVLLINRVSN
jgi:molybdopterin biosynthesis enzyme